MLRRDTRSKEYLEQFIFEINWLEAPLYFNNLGKVLRFDLESKSEEESERLIYNIFHDLFVKGSHMHILFYAYGDHTTKISWRMGKTYFKPFSIEKRFKKYYLSKTDEDYNELKPYIMAAFTIWDNFKIKKYVTDYLNSEIKCQLAFISLKKGAVLHLYDNRGFDLLSVDKAFLRNIYKKYEEFIIECNRAEILQSLEKKDSE